MSHKNIKNTSLDRIFVGLNRLGFTELSEIDVTEWSGEALEAIGCINQYEEAVSFIQVENHQASTPIGCYAVTQIARNHCFSEENLPVTPQIAVAEAVLSVNALSYNEEPMDGVLLDCNGTPLDVNERAYYRPYFDLQWEYNLWTSCRLHQNCFQPVRLTNNNFFNSIVCKETGHEEIYKDSTDEYNIYGGDTLRFSFKTGQIAIAYTRTPLDQETGKPLIPDDISYITAIINYNIMKMMTKDFYKGREGAQGRMLKAEADWNWYCKQAGNKSLMISGDDEHQNFLDQRSYVLPHNNRYYGFFGKLNKPENRNSFNHPDRLFRGYR